MQPSHVPLLASRHGGPALLGAAAVGILAGLAAPPTAAQTITRASLLPGGIEPPAHCSHPSISADGNLVVFANRGSDPSDSCWDLYVHDISTGVTTTIVSCHFTVQPARSALQPEICGSGSWVAYQAPSSGVTAIFVVPTGGGVPELMSVNPLGVAALFGSADPSISSDGSQVAFHTASTNLTSLVTNLHQDVYVRDRAASDTILISETFARGAEGNGRSEFAAISGNGRHVAFMSAATDLIATGLDTNNQADIYVRDRDPDGDGVFDQGNATTARVSVSSTGVQANNHCYNPAMSTDGRFVAFETWATSLVPKTNSAQDIYVHDRDPDMNGIFDEGNGVTTRVSVGSLGQEANFRCGYASLSGDGRYVAFHSLATSLTRNGTTFWDVYVHDRDPDENSAFDEGNGQTRLVSHDPNHLPGNLHSGLSAFSERPLAISADGTRVTFGSYASNLVPGDTNGVIDVYVHDLCTQTPIDLGHASTGSSGVKPEFKICGEFSRTGVGQLWLRRGPPLTAAGLIVGFGINPVPAFGGAIVPATWIGIPGFVTDGSGSTVLVTRNGGSGFTLTMQWLVFDAGLATEFALSNAIQVTWK